MATQISLPILDLSRYDANAGNGVYVPIDWSRAKEKWLGAIVKASEGNFVDPAYDEQIGAIKLADALWGSYSYFRTWYNPSNAADLFADQVERYGGYGELGVWLDVESNPSNDAPITYLNKVRTWLERLELRIQLAGVSVPIGIYSRNSFFDPLWVSAGRPIWPRKYLYYQALYPYSSITFPAMYEQIVHENYLPDAPPASMALGLCVLHQWTDKGKPRDVPGYPPYKLAVDFNLPYKRFWELSNTEPFPSPAPLLMRCLVSTLNIRTGPSGLYPSVGALHEGEVVVVNDVDGTDGAWVHFNLPNNRSGWSRVRSSTGTYFLKKF